ncbi:MAG TPA: YgaP-like transmembrane domain, partial [Candidatus Acidoferrales bacterium]|nr:YgaP-like transmembrane domain [Candidatus Acidoferrales bacterium]
EGSTSGWASSGRELVRSVPSRWALERQVRLVAGLLVVLSVVLSASLNRAWILLAAFVGCGLTFAGLTNICGMGMLLAKMPWNKASTTKVGTAQSCCSR